jgi:hypothetical protein
MSERLAVTTRDMLAAHSRLYDVQEQEEYSSYNASNRLPALNNHASSSETKPPQNNSPDIDSLASIATPEPSTIPTTTSSAASLSYTSFVPNNNSTVIPMQQQQTQPQSQQQNILPNTYNQEQIGMGNNDIDFNSCEFLYDSALFGQIIFDSTSNNNKLGSNNDINYWTPQYSMLTPSSNTATTMYQPYQ